MPKTNKPSLGEVLKKAGVRPPNEKPPALWKGPEDDGDMGGITQSMLSAFTVCRERFRVKFIEGLRPHGKFAPAMEYGQMWHICEEHLAAGTDWVIPLKNYCIELCKQYAMQKAEIEKWYNVCKLQFPIYVEFWSKHPNVKQRCPIYQEKVFHVPYTLNSGRVVYLRGKFDSVDCIGVDKTRGIYLQENKTKSSIDDQKLQRQLTFDLQSMMYLVALKESKLLPCEFCGGDQETGHQRLCPADTQIRGIRYNVIQRPLSGGKGSIVRHKAKGSKPAETTEHYYNRLTEIIQESPKSFFARWNAEVSQKDLLRFEERFLKPVLEQLCVWYDWAVTADWANNSIHYMTPFGVYNILAEGGSTDLDEYLLTGSDVGLARSETLFNELK